MNSRPLKKGSFGTKSFSFLARPLPNSFGNSHFVESHLTSLGNQPLSFCDL